MKTKQQQKEEARKAYQAILDPAWEAYHAILDPAWEAYQAIRDQAWEAYQAIRDQAWEAYQAKIKEIDAQPKPGNIIVDGVEYTRVNK
jgi:hypothetical protein